ncbi:hypothetical protein WJ972_12525 [Achromobacter insuavis]
MLDVAAAGGGVAGAAHGRHQVGIGVHANDERQVGRQHPLGAQALGDEGFGQQGGRHHGRRQPSS